MKKLNLKSCQKLPVLAILTSFSMPVMASDTTGLFTLFVGFPSALVGSAIVGLIYGAYTFTPTRNKKVIGFILGFIFLVFDGWIIFADTFDVLKERLLNRSFDIVLIICIIEIIAYLSLMYFTYKILINKKSIN